MIPLPCQLVPTELCREAIPLVLCISNVPSGFVCKIVQFLHVQISIQMLVCTDMLFTSSS